MAHCDALKKWQLLGAQALPVVAEERYQDGTP